MKTMRLAFFVRHWLSNAETIPPTVDHLAVAATLDNPPMRSPSCATGPNRCSGSPTRTTQPSSPPHSSLFLELVAGDLRTFSSFSSSPNSEPGRASVLLPARRCDIADSKPSIMPLAASAPVSSSVASTSPADPQARLFHACGIDPSVNPRIAATPSRPPPRPRLSRAPPWLHFLHRRQPRAEVFPSTSDSRLRTRFTSIRPALVIPISFAALYVDRHAILVFITGRSRRHGSRDDAAPGDAVR